MLELKDFEAAYNKVQEVVLPTKLIKSDYFSDQTGNDVYLKPENMQLTGAYKIRGAYYKISTLSEEEKQRIDHSICWKPCTGCCIGSSKTGSQSNDRYANNHSTVKG